MALQFSGIDARAYVTTTAPGYDPAIQDYAPGTTVTIQGGADAEHAYPAGSHVEVVAVGPHGLPSAENPLGWTKACTAETAGDPATWACKVTLSTDPAIAVGDYVYEATITDPSGRVVTEQGKFSDRPAPNPGFANAGALSPTSGPAGTVITVSSNSDWSDGSFATLTLGTATKKCTVTGGSFTGCTITVPPNLAAGDHDLTATQGTTTATASFKVTTPALSINPTSGKAGDVLRLTSSGWAPGSAIDVVLGTAKVTVTTNNSGAFPNNSNSDLTVPTGLDPGENTVTATAPGGAKATTNFTFVNTVSTKTELAASPQTVQVNGTVSLTATVTAGGSAVTTGSVKFQSSSNGNSWTDITTKALSSGVATLDVTAPASKAAAYYYRALYAANGNYEASEGSVTIAVTDQKPTLMATVTVATKPYDGTDSATITGCTLIGVLDSDSVTCDYSTASATFGSVDAGTGIAVAATGLKLSGTAAGKYVFGGLATGTGTIEKATSATEVTCPAGPYVYNGDAQTPCSAKVTGAGGLNETVTTGLSYQDNVNAGTAEASFAYAGDGNHTGSKGSAKFEIEKATSTTTVVCPAGPWVYNGKAQTPCYASVTGAGDLDLTITEGLTYDKNVNAGQATASYEWPGAANHTGSKGSATFTIDPAPLLVNFTGAPASIQFTPTSSAPNYTGTVSMRVGTKAAEGVLDDAQIRIQLTGLITKATAELTCTTGTTLNTAVHLCSETGQKLPLDAYVAVVSTMSGNFVGTTTAGMTVYDPKASGTAQGSLQFAWPKSPNLTDSASITFLGTLKPNRTGNNIQGGVLITRTWADETGTHTAMLKSNALGGLVFSKQGSCTTAVLNGKGTYTLDDVTVGNQQFTLQVTACGDSVEAVVLAPGYMNLPAGETLQVPTGAVTIKA